MKPAEQYQTPPHVKKCDCPACKLVRKIQADSRAAATQNNSPQTKEKTSINSKDFCAGDTLDF